MEKPKCTKCQDTGIYTTTPRNCAIQSHYCKCAVGAALWDKDMTTAYADIDKHAVLRSNMVPGTVFWVDPKDSGQWTLYQVLDKHTELDLATHKTRRLGRTHEDWSFLPVAESSIQPLAKSIPLISEQAKQRGVPVPVGATVRQLISENYIVDPTWPLDAVVRISAEISTGYVVTTLHYGFGHQQIYQQIEK